jgi:hypothetical protein
MENSTIVNRTIFCKKRNVNRLYKFFICVYKFNCGSRNRIHQATVDDVKIGSVEGQASCGNERYLFLVTGTGAGNVVPRDFREYQATQEGRHPHPHT